MHCTVSGITEAFLYSNRVFKCFWRSVNIVKLDLHRLDVDVEGLRVAGLTLGTLVSGQLGF